MASTLDSLLQQDLADFELLISDNGSTDNTEDICRAAARDTRVTYERSSTNRGAAWNYNRVLERARGRYFKWAADDDICRPTFLARCIELLENSSQAVVAWPSTVVIDENAQTIGNLDDGDLDLRQTDPVARLAQLLDHRVEWHPVFGVMRTDVLRRTSGIGAFVSADIALLAELALAGEFHQVTEPLFLRRYHAGRSLVANPSLAAHTAWYDPSKTDTRVVLPNVRLVRELLRRTTQAPIARLDRLRAATTVLRHWAVPHRRHIAGEIRRAIPTLAPSGN